MKRHACAVGRAAASLLFVLQFVALDSIVRGPRGWLADGRVVVSLIESAVVWTAILAVARTRARRIAISLVAAFLMVIQALVFRYFRAPIDVQVAESAISAWRDVAPVLSRAAPAVALSTIAGAAIEYALLTFGARPPQARHAGFALAGVGLFGAAPRHATPEVRAVFALGALGHDRPNAVASPIKLPLLHAERSDPPDVLFVLSESLRADDYDEATVPETLSLVPRRIDLREMRSVASYTALSLSTLITGRTQDAPREEILRAPSVFDYAHAARYSVGYWSAHAEDVFEATSIHAAVDRFVTVEDLVGYTPEDDPSLPLDRLAVDRFTAEIGAVDTARPAFFMLHLYSTHAPYHVEPSRAPFTPYTNVVTWSGMRELHNAAKDAIVEQDRHVARAIRSFLERAGERPWIIVFTSDHGEAFGEHGAIHHGQNLYDEQVHVPAWIAAGGGALDARASAALADHAARPVTHLDVLPTLLDAMGLRGNYALETYLGKLRGQSLLAPRAPRPMFPVTNCTAMFRCPLNTWGIYEGDHKLVAHLWDGGWECLVAPPASAERLADVNDERCARLRDESHRYFPLLPNGAPNR